MTGLRQPVRRVGWPKSTDSVEKLGSLHPKHFFGGTFTLAVVAIVDPGAI